MRTFARFRTRWSASTAAALLATGSLCGAQAQAQTPSEGRFPITEEQRRAAEQVAQAGVPLSALAADAPERYTVKSGDTLWSISALFLASPWRWPELWGMNKEQVNNPHLIYPGQTMVLLKGTDGRATLRLAEESGGSSLPGAPGDAVRLSPQVRDLGTANGRAALASIPANVIEPFLSRPMIVGATELNAFPRVVATQEGRVFVGRGDTAYARGLTDPRIDSYHVFRPANPLYDPDDTARKRPLAYEAFYLGIAQVAKPGEVATLRIQDSKQEIGVGDRLVPVQRQAVVSYVPRAPDRPVAGRVLSVYGGVAQAGTQNIVALNRGRRDGLEVGHVLSLLQIGETVQDRTSAKRETIKLPDEEIGHMFVFRVFDNVSYALVMRVTNTVKVGDRFSQPAQSTASRPSAPRR
jgi:hypothetical protein